MLQCCLNTSLQQISIINLLSLGILKLPKPEGKDTILVVANHFNKSAQVLPLSLPSTEIEEGKLLQDHVYSCKLTSKDS